MADKVSYSAGRFALSIDGDSPGFLSKASGGVIKGEVAQHKSGTDVFVRKNLATISYEDLKFSVAIGQGKGIWEWIKASFDKGFVQKNMELIAADFNYKSQSVREFMNAYIIDVTMPAMDGSSKDALYVDITTSCDTIRYKKGDGADIKGNANLNTKKALCSNFKLDIDGLPCQRVAKIDSWSWKQKVVKDEVGAFRDYSKHPAALEIPNLKLTISMADLDPWAQWHQSFVIDGKCADADEKSGVLTILGPDLKEELLTVNFSHLGIISLEPEGLEANKESVARFTVELYCEEMFIDTFAV